MEFIVMNSNEVFKYDFFKKGMSPSVNNLTNFKKPLN